MNAGMTRRLVWKEYRLQRSYWLALFFAAILFQAIALTTVSDSDRGQALMLVAATITSFYALGIGGIAFAGERETGTFEYQRSLPVTAWRVFCSKALFALVSTVALGVALAVAALLMARLRYSSWSLDGHLFFSWPARCLELLAWGWFFSLRSSRPLRAAVLGGMAAVCVSNFVQLFTGTRAYYSAYADFWDFFGVFFEATPAWATLLVAVAVLALDLWAARRWFDEKAVGPSKHRKPAEELRSIPSPPVSCMDWMATQSGGAWRGSNGAWQRHISEVSDRRAVVVRCGVMVIRLSNSLQPPCAVPFMLSDRQRPDRSVLFSGRSTALQFSVFCRTRRVSAARVVGAADSVRRAVGNLHCLDVAVVDVILQALATRITRGFLSFSRACRSSWFSQ
jgi:ABC-type transport system involved in multi-copper enzyme maturation permease subunit